MSRYLIDTNILSEPLKPQPNSGVMQRWQASTQEIAIASVTWHEVWYGCLRLPASRRSEQIQAYLQEILKTGWNSQNTSGEAPGLWSLTLSA